MHRLFLTATTAACIAIATAGHAEVGYENYRLNFGQMEVHDGTEFDQASGMAEAEWTVGDVRLAAGGFVLRFESGPDYETYVDIYGTVGYQVSSRLRAGFSIRSYDFERAGFDPDPENRFGGFMEYQNGPIEAVVYVDSDLDNVYSDYLYLGLSWAAPESPLRITGTYGEWSQASTDETSLRVAYGGPAWEATGFYYGYESGTYEEDELGLYGHYDVDGSAGLRLYAGLRRGDNNFGDDWTGLNLGLGYEIVPDGRLILGYQSRDWNDGAYVEKGLTLAFEMETGERGFVHQRMFAEDYDQAYRTGGIWYD